MSKIEVNQISSQCGSTLTVGQSGDTVTLAAGATQTGFGRTGTVNWDTTPITSTPTTGANGIGYFIDASGGVRTINLPASPSAGDIMAVSDYAQIAATNNITIGRNGSNIQGNASDLIIAKNGVAFTLVYVDATKGWVVTDTGAEADKEPDPVFITATGGTITCCGDYKIHTFTSPGTFTVTCAGNPVGSNSVDYLVIAGGGSGGAANGGGGGGGAGGYREGYNPGSYIASPLATTSLPVSATGFPITVGGGGAGISAGPSNGNAGSNSVFSTITSAGGGYGGGCIQNGGNGGSGGGAGKFNATGGTGNTPPVSPPQGNPGGSLLCAVGGNEGGGGGGAGCQGETIPTGNTRGGSGGVGVTSSISGTPTGYAGGGGSNSETGIQSGGTGGFHSGGATPSPLVSPSPQTPGFGGGNGSSGGCGSQTGVQNGTTNTGGGGGGVDVPQPGITSGNGGSGVVIIRYKYQ